MSVGDYVKIATLKSVAAFREYLESLGIEIPCDDALKEGKASPLAQPCELFGRKIGNRFVIQPMEGWDGTADGRPTEKVVRRWERFGTSGAKVIWGGEAVAVRHDGRANPNQLAINEHSRADLSALRDTVINEHRSVTGSATDLLIGLQLTHSGRYSRPNAHDRPEP